MSRVMPPPPARRPASSVALGPWSEGTRRRASRAAPRGPRRRRRPGSSRRAASITAPPCSATVTVTSVPSACGGSSVMPSSAAIAANAAAGCVSVASTRTPPARAFSSSAVPSAITRPWSITVIRSARRSASSRYWVVSRTVVPSATSSSIASHRSIRERGSRPVVGSSRNSTGGRATSAAARSSRRRMPPEYVLATRSAASDRSKRSSNSCARTFAAARRSPYSRADHHQVLDAGQVLVDRRVLAREPDPRPQLRRVADHVEPGHVRRPGVRLQQRREHAHRGRLPGPVRPEHAEDGPRRGLEIDAVQRADVAERLHEAFGTDRQSRSFACHEGSRRFRPGSVRNWKIIVADERDDLEPPADAAVAAAGPPRLAGLRAGRPAGGLAAHDPARRRAAAHARLPGRVDDRPGRRLPAARRHGDAAAAARRRRGDRDRRRPAHGRGRLGDRDRGDRGPRAGQARAGPPLAPAQARPGAPERDA